MKNKVLSYAILPAMLGLGIMGATVVSAHGVMGFGFSSASALTPDEIASRQQTMFQQESQILGISLDDVKTAWSEGKTMQQIIQEKGLNQTDIQNRLKDAGAAKMKTQLQTLVDKGIITQAQADARLKVMQTRLQNGKGRAGRGMMRGEWF